MRALNATLDNSTSAGYETGRVNVHLVAVVASSYVQAGVIDQDVLNLENGAGVLSLVHTARDLAGADVVTMVVPNTLTPTGTCGQARDPGEYAVVTIESNTNCLQRKAVPHEVGHLWGAAHQNWPTPLYADGLAYPSSGSPATCSVVHVHTPCRELTYSNPYANFSTGAVSGSVSRFNAHVVSDVAAWSSSYRSTPVQGGGAYTALSTPQRVLDSRPATTIGGYNTPWSANVPRPVSIAANASVPEGATSVVVNITAVQPAASGSLKAYAWGLATPTATTASFITGRNKATTAIGTYGLIEIQTDVATHVIVDVLGYFGGNAAATAKYSPITPALRPYDTRVAPLAGFAVNETRTINLSSLTGGAVPTSATAAVINITSANSWANGYLSIAPSSTSILNFTAGAPISNLAFAPLSSGQITITSSAVTHVIIDVLGFVGPTGAYQYTPIVPNRRVTSQPLGAGGTIDVTSTGTSVGIPSSAQAIVMNLTGQNASSTTWMVAYPPGTTAPSISHVNVTAVGPNNNTAIAAPSASGLVRVRNDTALVYVNVDITGYFS